MKNKFAFALAGLLAISSAAFAADWRDNGHRGGEQRGGYQQNYRGGDRENYRGGDRGYNNYGGRGYGGDYNHARDYGYRGGGGGVYVGGGPGYYSGYSGYAATPYVDPYAYSAPGPYDEEYVGPPPFAGAFWVGGRWTSGPRGRYWVRGNWGHRR